MTSRDSEFLTLNLLATGRGCLPLTMRIQVRESKGSWKTAADMEDGPTHPNGWAGPSATPPATCARASLQ